MTDTKRGATLTRRYMEFPTEWTIVSTAEEQNPEEGPMAYENPPAPSSNPLSTELSQPLRSELSWQQA